MDKDFYMSNKVNHLSIMRCALAAAAIYSGGYFELSSAFISILLCGTLLWRICQEKYTEIHMNDAVLCAVSIPLFYALSAIWAADRGLAVWGGVKYLPILLFGLNCALLSPDDRKKILMDLPLLASVLTVVSLLFSVIPAFRSQIFVAGRLGGFFMYPNTYAAFLAAAVLIWTEQFFDWVRNRKQTETKKKETGLLAEFVILSIGLYLSASRGVLVFFFPVFLLQLIRNRRAVSGNYVILFFGILGMILTGLITIGFLTDHRGIIDHLTSFSFTGSTLLGRILYWKDAIPIILKNPLGLGYMGYYCMQGSFQTGVYAVRSAHNGLIQIMLDVGWLPAIILLLALFRSFRSRTVSIWQKLMLLFLILHDSFDMNLDFIVMWFLLLLCLDWNELNSHRFRKHTGIAAALMTIGCACSLYIGTASYLYYCGYHAKSASLYPWNTFANIELMIEEADTRKQEEIADCIVKQNPYISLAWAVKANAKLEDGDVQSFFTYKEKSISLNRYDITSYEDYFEKLYVLVNRYYEAGDQESVKICLNKMMNINTMLEKVKADTDSLAWKLADKPVLELSADHQGFLDRISVPDN